MLRSRRFRRPTDIRINITALVDVTVLMLTFFMVVNKFATAEHVEMEVPDPDRSVARDQRLDEPVVINLLLAEPDQPPQYQLGALPIDSLDILSKRLTALEHIQPNLAVVLRADRRLPYRDVRAVMELLAEHGIERIRIVAKEAAES